VPVLLSAANNVARFDHNPVTGESLGLLIEEQRTNLVLQSEAFDSASWIQSNTTITTNAAVSPNGLTGGDKLVENTANSEHFTEQPLTPSAGTFSFSVFAKAAEYIVFRFRPVHVGAAQGSTTSVDFTLTGNGSFGVVPAHASASIQNVGNGWYRCNVTVTITGTITSLTHRIQLLKNNISVYTGDGTSGIYIWGAQLEAGAFPTSYIPTVASQVTRSADAASITGANFSSWYRQDEGTAYTSFSRFGTTGSPYVIGFSGGATATTSPRISLRTDASMNIQTQGIDASGQGWSSANFAGSPGFNVLANAVMTWSFETRSAAGCVAGNAVTSAGAAAAQMPDINTLFIGSAPALNGHIRKIAFYPKRLANDQLQALTT
jgi:hypothetical protein